MITRKVWHRDRFRLAHKLTHKTKKMTQLSKLSNRPGTLQRVAPGRSRTWGAVLAVALLLAACASDTEVDFENRRAAQELARSSRPKGSVYAGWRVFQERCASCHGADAGGTASGPDLLPRVAQMGPRRFVGLVLQRYDWMLPPAQVGQGRDALETFIDEVMQRKEPALVMPAWQGNPMVNAHIADLYAYLAARADGSQGKGRPPP